MQGQLPRYESDLMGKRSFAGSSSGSGQPSRQIFIDANSAFVVEREGFPRAHRRKPEFVFLVLEMAQDPSPQPPRLLEIPQPDVGIKQQSQSRRTSHSSSSFAGDTMSPRISNVPFIDAIQALRSSTVVGGTTSATGLPNRVIRIGFFVARTCSSRARHLALNSEMAISSITFPLWSFYHTMVIFLDYSM